MRRVIDGFCYNGETEILRLRRLELGKWVNGTAVVTTAFNFHGQPHKRVKLPSDMTEDVDIKHMTLPGSAFDVCVNERQEYNHYCTLSIAKNSIADVLKQFFLEEDDWIIFGDPDEIPNRHIVRLLHECEVPVGPNYPHDALHLNAAAHYLYDTHCNVTSSVWMSSRNYKTPVAVKVATMKEYGLRSFQANRRPWCSPHGPFASCEKRDRDKGDMYMEQACWHLSGFGGISQVQVKYEDNSDRQKVAPNETIMRECLEFDRDRHNTIVAMPEPAREYPHVPHDLHLSTDFSSFFHADAPEERTGGAHRRSADAPEDDEERTPRKARSPHWGGADEPEPDGGPPRDGEMKTKNKQNRHMHKKRRKALEGDMDEPEPGKNRHKKEKKARKKAAKRWTRDALATGTRAVPET